MEMHTARDDLVPVFVNGRRWSAMPAYSSTWQVRKACAGYLTAKERIIECCFRHGAYHVRTQ